MRRIGRGADVIPADAGIQGKTKHAVGAAGARSECIVGRENRMFLCSLDSRVRGNDGVCARHLSRGFYIE